MTYKGERSRQFPTKISTTQFTKLFILHLLNEKSYYGNEIIDEIRSRLKDNWAPSPGMIYPMLRELEAEEYIYGWWREPDKRSIRSYRITDSGIEHYNRIKLLYQPSLKDALKMLECIMTELYKSI